MEVVDLIWFLTKSSCFIRSPTHPVGGGGGSCGGVVLMVVVVLEVVMLEKEMVQWRRARTLRWGGEQR